MKDFHQSFFRSRYKFVYWTCLLLLSMYYLCEIALYNYSTLSAVIVFVRQSLSAVCVFVKCKGKRQIDCSPVNERSSLDPRHGPSNRIATVIDEI